MNKRAPIFWSHLVILAVAPAVLAAGVLYMIYAPLAVKAEREVLQFRDDVLDAARKERAESTPVGAMLPFLKIAPAASARLDALQAQSQVLVYRRELAAEFATRGAIVLVALGCFHLFLHIKRPNQSSEPTSMSVTPPAAQEPRQP